MVDMTSHKRNSHYDSYIWCGDIIFIPAIMMMMMMMMMMKRNIVMVMRQRRCYSVFTDYPHYTDVSPTPISEYINLFRDSIQPGEKLTDITPVTLAGRIKRKHCTSKKIGFMDILGSNGSQSVQIVLSQRLFDNNKDNFDTAINVLRRGDIVTFTGIPGKTRVGELSLFATSTKLLAPCRRSLPLELQDVGVRHMNRHIDFIVNPNNLTPILLRARVLKTMRTFFDSRGFVEVETPILSRHAGGASALPFTTISNALGTQVPLSLRVAPELPLKQLVVSGLERVYEIGKVFRNEALDSTHHPEFSTCEFYQAYADFDELLDTTESLLSQIVEEATGSPRVALADGTEVNFAPPYARIDFIPELENRLNCSLPDLNSSDDEAATVNALLAICRDHDIPTDCSHTIQSLLDHMSDHVIISTLMQPTFLCNIPHIMSPLAKMHADPTRAGRGETARFELFVAGKELCNAYVELNNPDEQRDRFRMQAMMRSNGDTEAHCPDENFCEILEYGLPPTVGWGMGIDRLIMLLAGKNHIREVLTSSLRKDDNNDRVVSEVISNSSNEIQSK